MAQWLSAERWLMGTEVKVELLAEGREDGPKVLEDALAVMQDVDWMMNPLNPDSAIYQVNQDAATQPVVVPAAMFQVVERALYYSRLSEGAFDISFGAVGRLYDYRAGNAPSDADLAASLPGVSYRDIHTDAAAGSISFSRPGMYIDLGGIAKGFAVDQAIEVLQRAGITSGFASAGGDSRILGSHGDRPRMIGIRHPRKDGEFAVMIPLSDTAISTSGDYERFFVDGELRFHHILDPGTGRSVNGVQSVSILTTLAVDSDALSTTVFVLGVRRGLALVDSLPAADAIIIDDKGQLHYSQGLLRKSSAR